MKTILKPAVYKILKLFYNNKNNPLHLRDIARKTGLNESSIFRQLNMLVKENVFKTYPEANLKKFKVNNLILPLIFPLFDEERIKNLPLLRKNALNEYIRQLKEKPVIALVFGSTAKGTFRDDSDIDFLIVTNSRQNDKDTKKYVQALTNIRIQSFKITENNFAEELIRKQDKVVQSALETGFPCFNEKYFYEVIYGRNRA